MEPIREFWQYTLLNGNKNIQKHKAIIFFMGMLFLGYREDLVFFIENRL